MAAIAARPAVTRCCSISRATAARTSSADVDLSRTVGWFTSLFPVRLDPGALDLDEALAGGAALGRALKSIKEQLRALPDNGLGYGLLRYLNPQTAAQLAAFATPQIGFNYLGRFAAPAAADWGAGARGGAAGRQRSRRCRSATRSRSMRSPSMSARDPS